MGEEQEKSFVRWQGITITQLGYVSNLILGFATASLGFSLTLLRDKDFVPQSWAKRIFLLSLCAVLISIFSGIWCAINGVRLIDYVISERQLKSRNVGVS